MSKQLTKGINSLRRQYWNKLSQGDNPALTQDLTSSYRTTIKLKLRLSDDTKIKKTQEENKQIHGKESYYCDPKSNSKTSPWLLEQDNLVDSNELQIAFNNVIEAKKQYMKALQDKKKTDSATFANFLFGDSDSIVEVVKKIVELEFSLRDYVKKSGKFFDLKDINKLDVEKTNFALVNKNFIMTLNGTNLDLDLINLNLVKIANVENNKIKFNHNHYTPIKDKTNELYDIKRRNLFLLKSQLKNQIIQSSRFKNWLPSVDLNETTKRDIINLFLNTEITTIENLMVVSENVEELLQIKNSSDSKNEILTNASRLIGVNGQEYLAKFGIGEYNSNSKKEELLGERINLIQTNINSINNFAISPQFNDWISKNNNKFCYNVKSVYLLHLKGDLKEKLQLLEENLRQPFLVLRNFVSEEYKRLLIIKNLPSFFDQRCTFEFDFVPYNFLYNSVKSLILQSVDSLNITEDAKKNLKDKIFDKQEISFAKTFKSEISKKNPAGYKKESKHIQSLAYIWATMVLKSNPFDFGNDTIESGVKSDLSDLDGILSKVANGKPLIVQDFRADFKLKIDLTADEFSKLFQICLVKKDYQYNQILITQYSGKNGLGLKGVARITIEDSIQKLIEEPTKPMTKEEFGAQVDSQWNKIDYEFKSKSGLISKVGTQFLPLLNKVGENIKDIKDFIQNGFEGVVDEKGMIYQPLSEDEYSRVKVKTKFLELSQSLLTKIKNQYDVGDKYRDFRCVFQLKALANFWLKAAFNLKPKDRVSVEEKINELISIISQLSLDCNQSIYIADCLDIPNENKQGELWFVKDNGGKDRICLAIPKIGDIKVNSEVSIVNKKFYRFSYFCEPQLSRADIDKKFESRIKTQEGEERYSQWLDFKQIKMSEVININDYNIFELQFGEQLARNYLFGNGESNFNKLFQNGVDYNHSDRTLSVISGLSLINPIHKEGEFYLKLTILHLYKLNLENLTRDTPTIVEGRDTGENIFVTAANFKIESDSIKVNSMFNPILQSSQIYKEYHHKIIECINNNGYIPISTRLEYRNKKKFILEQLVNNQQQIIVKNRLNNNKLSSYIVYEDNLLQKQKIDITQKSTLIAGLNDSNNSILEQTTLYNHDKIRKQFEQAIKYLVVGGGKKDYKESKNLVSKTKKTGLGLTFTKFSSQICINCGNHNCNFDTRELVESKKSLKHWKKTNTLHPHRNLVKELSDNNFRTKMVHNNVEIAECRYCGFKTLCDYQAGLNLSIFNIFDNYITSKLAQKEDLQDLPKEIINLFPNLTSWKNTIFKNGESWIDYCQPKYQSRKENEEAYVSLIVELYQKYLTDNNFTIDSRIIKYNNVIGLDNSFLRKISDKIIELQSGCGNQEQYFKKLSLIGALQPKKSKELMGQESCAEFSSHGFVRYLIADEIIQLSNISNRIKDCFKILVDSNSYLEYSDTNQFLRDFNNYPIIWSKFKSKWEQYLLSTDEFKDENTQKHDIIGRERMNHTKSKEFRKKYNKTLSTIQKCLNMECSIEQTKEIIKEL